MHKLVLDALIGEGGISPMLNQEVNQSASCTP